ncbi:TNF receptor-associated factor 3-like [Paramuricea clavata]|uniref:TNF receptor-associated factor 3-like n=1 Tax=Paramuricea clavata TaxID=317549 RepID=A0A6S7JZF6_PARCT|nr:TNF receptor-associated factor 3-like [Paramuricea clavata]
MTVNNIPFLLQAHINLCDHTVIICVHTQCPTKVKRYLLAKHLEEECLYRSVMCENCQETLPFAYIEKHIKESCQVAPLTCQYCQLTNIPRKEMRKHQTEECEEIVVECDCKSIGCDYTKVSKRKELRKHYKDASRFHIQLLLRFIFELQGEMQNRAPKFENFATKQLVLDEVNRVKDAISAEIKTMESKFSAMMATVNGLIRRLENVDSSGASSSNGSGSNAEIRRIEMRMGKEIEKLQAKNNRLETQLREAMEAMERYQNKIEQIDQSVAVITARFADLEPREPSQTKVNYNGVLLWKIEGYQRKRQDAINGVKTTIFSPYFYTSEFGYKMCAKIYMNGYGFRKESHLSLFFVVMKGDYDALQTWPLQKKITMMLLDQGNGDHMIHVFNSDPQSSSFRRPNSDMNEPSRWPLQIPLDGLTSRSPRQFVKDDVMFIKIIVEELQ